MPMTTSLLRATLRMLAAAAIFISAMAAASALSGAKQSGTTMTPDHTATGASHDGQRLTTQNPISSPFADTYADPALIRGKDGYWYMYATSDPLRSAPSPFGLMHVARSRDFAHWEYLGTIFDDADRPAWTTSSSFYWAPDIRYVDEQYLLYYTATDTLAESGPWNFAIGVATAPTPAGPWTDSGGPVVAPRPDGGGGFFNTIDPAMFADDDGTRYLYFGGFHGGLWVAALDESATRAVGEPVRVARPDRYEGSFVVKRDGYYYLTASSANCCAGPVTGYSVYAGRSTSPLGPFVDHEGVSLLDSRVGGTQVLVQNGNRWIGVGHHAIVTDASGQDYIVYHGIDRNNAWLNEPGGINRRPTLIDRLDWVDGWPVARAGAGPSDSPQRAPVTASRLGIDSGAPAANAALVRLSGEWLAGDDHTGDGGALARLIPTADGSAAVATRMVAPPRVRAEVDVRFPSGEGTFSFGIGEVSRGRLSVTLDAIARQLLVEVRTTHGTRREVTGLPDRFTPAVWRSLAVEVRDRRAVARLSESRLGDLDAEVAIVLPPGIPGKAPLRLVATGAEAQLDNLTVAEAHTPVTTLVPAPVAGARLFAEEFDAGLDGGWTWVRPDPSVAVVDGRLQWQLASVDVVGSGNTGPLLLRTPPPGAWIAETKLLLDLGVDTIRNFQQAGLIVYLDDDHFVRLGDVAIWSARQVEFGKELAAAGRRDWGAHLGGPVASTMWLRIAHRVDPKTGDLHYRSASSRDGKHWRWGATLTLPAGTAPRIGLYAGGGADPPTVASFEHFRLHEIR